MTPEHVRAINARVADDLHANAEAIDRTFGKMLDVLQQLAGDLGSNDLLHVVDQCRAVVETTVRGLRACAHAVRD